MKIAIVHDYLHQYGGAEKMVEQWLEMYPNADIYTSFITPEKFSNSKLILKAFKEKRIKTTWLQLWLPKLIRFYKHFFWLYPIIMSFVTVKNYDKVIISSTFCGKNIKLKNNQRVVHYCHSPTRFLYNMVTEIDHNSLSTIYRIVIPFFKPPLRFLDQRAIKHLVKNNTVWVANSKHIQALIKKVYHVDSVVVYPAVEINDFLINPRGTAFGEDKFYLCHGRISFHKRIDLAIISCIQSGRNLKISGTSALPSEIEKLKNLALTTKKNYVTNNPTKKAGKIEFLGHTSKKELMNLVKSCSGFIFPGIEDFGIAPIEILAGGVPLIAFGEGGALEYVKDKENGVLFHRQNVESLIDALDQFEKLKFNVPTIRNSAKQFEEEVFKIKFDKILNG
jgi:glycosyltransferase involved in cell wall biosynthesis